MQGKVGPEKRKPLDIRGKNPLILSGEEGEEKESAIEGAA